MKTILVVDDNSENAYMLEVLLEASGYKTIIASNGEEGLQKIRIEPVDMIISDILMPNMDGYLFCYECKKDTTLKNIPFIFYSATYTDIADEEFALKLGAEAFIKKPTDQDEFLKIIEANFVTQKSSSQQYDQDTNEEEILVLYNKRLINKLEKKNISLSTEIKEREKITMELDKSMQRNQLLLHGIPDMFFILDGNGVFTDYHNPDGLTTYVKPKDFIDKKLNEVLPEALAIETLRNVNIVLKGGEIPNHQYFLDYPEGSRQFEARYVSINKKEVLVIIRDITARKEYEEKLILLNEEVTKSEKFFKGVLENSNDLITIIDNTGKTIYVSPSVPKKFGYTHEECLNLNIIDVVHPDDALIMQEFIMKVLMHPGVTIECPLIQERKKDGNYIWIEGTLTNFLETEGINGIVANYRDITERKKSEEKLIRSEAKLKDAQALAKIGSWDIDLLNKQQTWSDEIFRMFGLKVGEVIPSIKIFLTFVHPDDKDYVSEGISNAFDVQVDTALNFRFIPKEGEIRYGHLDSQFEFDAKNKPIRLFGVVQDITKQKIDELQLEQQNANLIKTNKELDRFVYSTSHDLRAPLTSLLGLINILEESTDTEPSEQKELLKMMEQSVKKLDLFIGDIIEYSRNARTDVEKEEINFENKIKAVREKLMYMDGAPNTTLNVTINQNGKFVSDKSRMNIILSNILSNAIKYQDKNKETHFVAITISNDAANATIEIEDNGIGIDQKNHAKIFEMFFRGTTLSNGSGLGMYIVKETLDKLNGSIALESEINIGSKFIISIPNLV